MQDGARVSGKDCDLTVEDIGDILDEDFQALQKCFDVFENNFHKKIQRRGKRKRGEENTSKEKIEWDDLEAIAYGLGLLPRSLELDFSRVLSIAEVEMNSSKCNKGLNGRDKMVGLFDFAAP